MSHAPWDFEEARGHARKASSFQEAAEESVKEAYKAYALAEEAYRIALAKRIVELRAEGIPATLCADLARGTESIARLKTVREIAEGVREAAGQSTWRRAADRRDTERFSEWSMKRELAEGR
jgi:hypothetical protein